MKNRKMLVKWGVVGVVVLSALGVGMGSAGADVGSVSLFEDHAHLHLDRTMVSPGEQVHVFAHCPRGEVLNHVGSEAFSATGEDGPYSGNGGVAAFSASGTRTHIAKGVATIRPDAEPGVYRVAQRCGGGYVGDLEIRVVPADR